MLETNTIAPDFSLPDQDETVHTLSEYTNQWKLVYFYPKDDTPGCTKEACAISEIYDEFTKLGVIVFGISKDTPRSHHTFADKYNLPFTLLSDPEMEIIKAYGAFKPKKMFGKAVRGTHRISYLLDERNTVVKVYEKVDPAHHALEILADIKSHRS